MKFSISKKLLLLMSFLEGASVMVCELISAKLLAPFFGTSLTVWAAVLGLTLGGLTLGYFFGGKLSSKYYKNYNLLYFVLVLASIFLVAMPFLALSIMNVTLGLSLELGAIISLLVFMVPPLILMGMVSPIIINLLTETSNVAGNNAGNVYAISTVGGILATFLLGFYVIPEYGLKIPCITSGILLALVPLFLYIKSYRVNGVIFIVVLSIFSFLSFTNEVKYNDEYKIIYQSEGIMGQVKVVDHPSYQISEDAREGRALIVNNTLQTFVDKRNNLQNSLWSWANYFPTAASIFPPGSKVLLLGLGGGTLVKQLTSLGFDVDVVEIDKRIYDVSIEYFNMDPKIPVYIDDARHFIRTVDQKYDIIIFDTFLSESVPEHILTEEGITDAENILNEKGMIMVNFYGFIEGEEGLAARCVYKTFEHLNFNTHILTTPGTADTRNIIFLCSKSNLDFNKTRYESQNFPDITNLPYYFYQPDNSMLLDSKILSDQKPQLSKLYRKVAMRWKINYNNYYRKNFQE